MQIDELDQVLSLLQHRLAVASREERFNYVLVFENRGPEAGASRHHPHLQLYGMQVVPPGVEDLRNRARRHWEIREIGDVLVAELDQGERPTTSCFTPPSSAMHLSGTAFDGTSRSCRD